MTHGDRSMRKCNRRESEILTDGAGFDKCGYFQPGLVSMGTIEITVLLFGACREAAGISEFKFELVPPANAAAAWTEIKKRYPALERFERSALVAINEEHARPDQALQGGDTLAIFPPVSGGID
jgi:molybdopterin converting factor subunit 1